MEILFLAFLICNLPKISIFYKEFGKDRVCKILSEGWVGRVEAESIGCQNQVNCVVAQ